MGCGERVFKEDRSGLAVRVVHDWGLPVYADVVEHSDTDGDTEGHSTGHSGTGRVGRGGVCERGVSVSMGDSSGMGGRGGLSGRAGGLGALTDSCSSRRTTWSSSGSGSVRNGEKHLLPTTPPAAS